MRYSFFVTGALLGGVLLGAFVAKAQEASEPPKPAAAGVSFSPILRTEVAQDTPDTRPLSGVQNLSLGSQSASHSFLLPSFGIITAMQINPYQSNQAGAGSLISTTYMSGRLGINKVSNRSELLVDYLAGGGFSSYSNQGSSVIQSLDFLENIHSGRWSQMFGEQFSYLPQSSFNFGGLGGLNNLGINLGSVGSTPGFRQDILPNQSIITNGAARLSNAVIAQTGYALGYRSSLAFSGAYTTLDFLGNGLENSSTVSAGAGYNYLLSPLNSMSVSYGYGRVMLSNSVRGIENHGVLLSFARRITGRLSFQAGAGPDVQLYGAPIKGPSTYLSWTALSALNYQFQRFSAGFNYSHALSGGSGVLPGAETDMFEGHVGRAFGNWQTSISASYSRNQALPQTVANANSIRLHTWFGSVQASRNFGHYGSLFISYNASRQSNLAGICSLAACRANALLQTVSVGYNWGLRPITLE